MRPTEKETTMFNDIVAHQNQVEDRILQNWIATQQLAQDAPAFQPK